jgi:hypothetical protein
MLGVHSTEVRSEDEKKGGSRMEIRRMEEKIRGTF